MCPKNALFHCVRFLDAELSNKAYGVNDSSGNQRLVVLGTSSPTVFDTHALVTLSQLEPVDATKCKMLPNVVPMNQVWSTFFIQSNDSGAQTLYMIYNHYEIERKLTPSTENGTKDIDYLVARSPTKDDYDYYVELEKTGGGQGSPQLKRYRIEAFPNQPSPDCAAERPDNNLHQPKPMVTTLEANSGVGNEPNH